MTRATQPRHHPTTTTTTTTTTTLKNKGKYQTIELQNRSSTRSLRFPAEKYARTS
ncbi:hypothetical protein PGTUg99_028185 [Puccinia graminis f. sp. tritici]|uniref:Uncharacterized protein n=1 Tax=Puccinia graminis f. sp. tritici TaxID=56615 RepID=A0A5B0SFS9_PUCGR|nr:hypothetical protein PGTUg99_028185 [Puccinia graminis f. sp. tritici]